MAADGALPPAPAPPPPPPLPEAASRLPEPPPAFHAEHPSAAALRDLDLPLSPVVAPPAIAASEGGNHDAAAAGGSPRMLRSASSRPVSVAMLHRPGTEVWTWGRGDCGQLATGSLEDSHVPTLVEGLHGRDIVSLSAGLLHTAAVTGESRGWAERCACAASAPLTATSSPSALQPTASSTPPAATTASSWGSAPKMRWCRRA